MRETFQVGRTKYTAAHLLAHLIVVPFTSVIYGKHVFSRDGETVAQKKSAIGPTVPMKKPLCFLSRDSSMIPSFLERVHSSPRPSFQMMIKLRIHKTIDRTETPTQAAICNRKNSAHKWAWSGHMLSACVSTLPRLLTHQLNMAEVQSKMKVCVDAYVKSCLLAACIADVTTYLGAYRVEKWPRNDASEWGECTAVREVAIVPESEQMAVWRETGGGPIPPPPPVVGVSVIQC